MKTVLLVSTFLHICSLTSSLTNTTPIPDLDIAVNKLMRQENVNEQNNLAVIPNMQFDFVSMLKIMAKYEIQEEVKKWDASLKSVADSFKNVQVSTNKNYPSAALELVVLGGRTYFFSKKQRLSWMDSVSFCRLYGMELVSVETKEEDDLIANHLNSLGLTVVKGESYTYISANKIGSASWKWLNGRPVTYTNWQMYQPDGPNSQHCIVYTNGGTWADIDCNDRAWHFVCEQSSIH